MSETQAKDTKRASTNLEYTVEADAPRNNDVLVQSIPGCRLRGAISSSKSVITNPQALEGDEMPIPKDQSRHLGSLPRIPGMTLTVNLKNRTYKIEDPLYKNEELCERIRRGLESDDRPIARGAKIQGKPPQEGKLDSDYFKTLCREVHYMLKANMVKSIGTPWPSMDVIDDLDGDYLLNPGQKVENSQPRYEKDYKEWKENLDRVGG